MEVKEVTSPNPLSPSPLDDWYTTPSTSFEDSFSEAALKEDLWSFGIMWSYVAFHLSSVEELYAAIEEAHLKIQETKEEFRSLAINFPSFDLVVNEDGGISNSYFLVDQTGQKRFVIKPVDEDAGCINNREFPTPFLDNCIRTDMPLYLSAMREVLASEIVRSAGLYDLVPKTVLAILESDRFHDLSDGVSYEERDRYQELTSPVDREKLCSAQEYIPNAKSLFEALHDMQMAGLSYEEIAARFDPQDFEEANILVWLTNDTDAHGGNFLVYPKGFDSIGNEILGLKKIDNGLAFPDKNGYLVNALAYLSNAKAALSEEGRRKIEALDVETLSESFKKLGLESALPAFKQRIAALKTLVKTPGITLKEINNAMMQLGKKA